MGFVVRDGLGRHKAANPGGVSTCAYKMQTV
jgi:hypothetical protein